MLKYADLTQGIGAFERTFKNLDTPFTTMLRLTSEKTSINECYERLNPTPKFEIYPRTKNWEKILDDTKLKNLDIVGVTFDIGKEYLLDSEIIKKVEIALKLNPKCIIFDMNKSFLGTKHRKEFNAIYNELEIAGYKSFYRQINAFRLASPQYRERSYLVAFRNDVAENRRFKFPKTFNSVMKINDIAQNTVDDKYYLSEQEQQKIIDEMNEVEKFSCCYPQLHLEKLVVGNNNRKNRRVASSVAGRVYSVQGLVGSVEWKHSINSVPKIVKLNGDIPGRRDVVLEEVLHGNYSNYDSKQIIRRLTPLEVWLLNGYLHDDFEKCREEMTDIDLYNNVGSIMIYPLDEIMINVLAFLEGVEN
nr:MAG TPA: Cytosine specific methyltransferase [Caudoviricetes sp.]